MLISSSNKRSTRGRQDNLPPRKQRGVDRYVMCKMEAAAGSGKRVTLILTDKIKGTVLVKLDRSEIPNEITAKLPATGEYLITVAEQVLTPKDKRFKGDYCLTLEATPEIYQTLEPFLLVE
jgi:hypothetical protein